MQNNRNNKSLIYNRKLLANNKIKQAQMEITRMKKDDDHPPPTTITIERDKDYTEIPNRSMLLIIFTV